MRPPFVGRRFLNILPRRRPSATRVLRSLHTFYKRGDPNVDAPPKRERRKPLYSRVADAWNNTPTKWYPLPIGVGALLLAAVQYRKEQRKRNEPEVVADDNGTVVKVKHPWQVNVLGALPLRNLSRLWGYLNSLELPVWFRPTGYRIYAWVFGCNLNEIEPSDLRSYKSLGDFFYRGLKAGARPVANTALVSPADGTVIHFGVIDNHQIEQVKGVTYSVDALLGIPSSKPAHEVEFAARPTADVDDEEFANVNGIDYSLGQLLGHTALEDPEAEAMEEGTISRPDSPTGIKDVATTPKDSVDHLQKTAEVAATLGSQSMPPLTRKATGQVKPGNQLYFTVIYLAPGDYHRFHSPTAWVVERRRHFAGELFSVSPFLVKRLANLFVLNERVALLGRWRYGFFGMVPVGATNVGSIKVNFDKKLRTNLPERPPPPSPGTYSEATYHSASALLRGQPLVAGQEMGGFCLGSTIVLVYEAPPNFQFNITPGQKVRVGQALGDVSSQ
ncbi:phosphatidylserine decarboxylase 1 [Tulasnella sp. UAMH 9824]|nr:phosphatidylserine decarboxylase 1 [Tulasnella sp. UAMH 9824]